MKYFYGEIFQIYDVLYIVNCTLTAVNIHVQESWDFLQLQCALYMNSEMSGIPLAMAVSTCHICGKGRYNNVRATTFTGQHDNHYLIHCVAISFCSQKKQHEVLCND